MKKLLIPILTLVIGLFIGYYYCKKTSSESDFIDGSHLTKHGVDFVNKFYADSSYVFTEGSHRISDSMARVLITDYQHSNGRGLFPMRNPARDRLNGYYIDREPLDAILSNKSFTGVNVYFARDSAAHAQGTSGRIYTLVYMGATKNKTGIQTQGETTDYLNQNSRVAGGGAYDFVKPCPDACGNFLTMGKK
jgi:hypothetical protein